MYGSSMSEKALERAKWVEIRRASLQIPLSWEAGFRDLKGVAYRRRPEDTAWRGEKGKEEVMRVRGRGEGGYRGGGKGRGYEGEGKEDTGEG